jgi:iron(III) transport system substrate-binding protein
MNWSRKTVTATVSVFTLAIMSLIATSAATAAESSSALAKLIDGAKKEGKVLYASSGEAPEMFEELNRRFNKKFGLNIEVQGVPLTASAAATRILQEKAANRLTIDVTHPSYTLVQGFIGKGILAEYDWTGVFGKVLPGIREAAENVPKFLKNQVLDYQHLVYMPLFNTKLVSRSDIPKKWEDLLDPKWSGQKIVLDPRGNSLYLLFLEYGEKWVLDYASKLVKQEPLFVRGSPTIAKAVGRGEAPLGITGFSNILEQKMEGNPVDFAPFEVSGVVPQVLVAVQGSPHPNAAKLFAAWTATEGMLALQENDGTGRAWPGSEWIMAKQLEKAQVKLAFTSTPEQMEAAKGVIAKVGKIMQQKRR